MAQPFIERVDVTAGLARCQEVDRMAVAQVVEDEPHELGSILRALLGNRVGNAPGAALVVSKVDRLTRSVA
jgi:hypothetical protein